MLFMGPMNIQRIVLKVMKFLSTLRVSKKLILVKIRKKKILMILLIHLIIKCFTISKLDLQSKYTFSKKIKNDCFKSYVEKV